MTICLIFNFVSKARFHARGKCKCRWPCCDKESLNRVLKLRKRAATVILSSKTDSPSVRFVNNLNWIPFYEEKFSNLFQILYPIFYRDMLLLIIKSILEILDMLSIT